VSALRWRVEFWVDVREHEPIGAETQARFLALGLEVIQPSPGRMLASWDDCTVVVVQEGGQPHFEGNFEVRSASTGEVLAHVCAWDDYAVSIRPDYVRVTGQLGETFGDGPSGEFRLFPALPAQPEVAP
jgi:hypothetical protein